MDLSVIFFLGHMKMTIENVLLFFCSGENSGIEEIIIKTIGLDVIRLVLWLPLLLFYVVRCKIHG